ncbi:MAG: UDP-N-acetylmuramate dehydrogenase [bacterium]
MIRLAELFGPRLKRDYPIARDTSLKIGGNAEGMLDVFTIDELRQVILVTREYGIPLKVLGHGTNILVSDEGVAGLVVRLKGDFAAAHKDEDNRLMCGAGCPLSLLIKEAVKHALVGPEVLLGIPGSIGGAIVMNAGTDGGSIGDLVEKVECMTSEGTLVEKEKSRMGFGYRRCSLEKDCIIVKATFHLLPGHDMQERMAQVRNKRRESQPEKVKTAGCVFKNPEGDFAGRLIEEVGLKGYEMGNVRISEKHANFFISKEDSTSEDFLSLMGFVRERVKALRGVELTPEIVIFK